MKIKHGLSIQNNSLCNTSILYDYLLSLTFSTLRQKCILQKKKTKQNINNYTFTSKFKIQFLMAYFQEEDFSIINFAKTSNI